MIMMNLMIWRCKYEPFFNMMKRDNSVGGSQQEDPKETDGEEDEAAADLLPPETQVGTFRAGPGKWGSCVRVINPATVKDFCFVFG